MKFDTLGRLRNMDLPDGKTAVLYSVYEAVSNSIHAINDRFGEENAQANGKISVDVELNAENEVEKITVIDNGVGFNEDNISSIETSDSRYKYQRGGKGVGRFVWIKTFSKIKIQSKYEDDGKIKNVKFDFVPEEDESIQNKIIKDSSSANTGSKITISGPRKSQGGKMNHATFMKDLALHFFPLFVSNTLPDIDLSYNGEARNLADFIADKVDEPVRERISFEVAGETWNVDIDHLFVDPSISKELRNSYLLTAHGRLVGDPVSIDRRYALNELSNGKSYVAVISGEPLDDRVDQQRMNFRFNKEQKDTLEAAVLVAIEGFLSEHIGLVRDRQKKTVESVLYEHPQLSSQIDSVDDYVKGLYPGMDDEQIGQNLFVLLYREEKEIRKRVAKIAADGTLDASQKTAIEETLKELAEQERNRLAELVVKRHQVLQAAHILLKFSNEENEKYYYEKLVHDLIIPMGKMYTQGDYDDHNLWILDESLSGYQFFTSDKTIRSIVGSDGSLKEPDAVFFNPLGFRQPDSNSPVSIVEFKRPGDGKISSNPIDQVLEYIEDFRNQKVKDIDGELVTDIDEKTQFNCFIVCELTEQTRALLSRSIAQFPMPDGEGYYGWSQPHRASIQVVSFKKMLRDALVRNQAYFDALKLGSPSVAAKRRTAKARAKPSRSNIKVVAR